MDQTGGYEKIYRDLLDELKSVDLTQAAKVLEFEFLAVLATIFVRQLIEEMSAY